MQHPFKPTVIRTAPTRDVIPAKAGIHRPAMLPTEAK